MLRLSLALAVLLAPVSATMAASFDCAAARTFFERTICSDPELSGLDETLALAFATALGGLSPEATKRVRQDQRQWLDWASRAVTTDAQPMHEANTQFSDTGNLNSLKGLFGSRIDVLASSRLDGRLRFYPVSGFAALVDPNAEPNSGWRVAVKELVMPRIDGSGPEALAFNGFIDQWIGDFAEQLRLAGLSGEGLDPESDESTTLTMEGVGPERISVERLDYVYGHGGAHGNWAITYRHFLRDERRALVAEDIFSGAKWQDKLLDIVIEELRREVGENLMLDDKRDIAGSVADPERWRFSDREFTVQFQPYEVSFYAYGAPTISISWDRLTAITTPEAQSIASEF